MLSFALLCQGYLAKFTTFTEHFMNFKLLATVSPWLHFREFVAIHVQMTFLYFLNLEQLNGRQIRKIKNEVVIIISEFLAEFVFSVIEWLVQESTGGRNRKKTYSKPTADRE